jgi:hypothetical protein
MTPYPDQQRLFYTRLLFAIGAAWLAAVVIGAQSGFILSLYQPIIGAIVAATIIAPTVWYFMSPGLRRHMEHIGHRRIALFHIWRIPAALLFFWYGLQGLLPPLFWILAGVGDLMAGSYAAWLMFKPESARSYRSFHIFGLTYTLLLDPRMAPIALLPMALIPLFGVGISGATHLMAFDMLRRNVGMTDSRPTKAGSGGAITAS